MMEREKDFANIQRVNQSNIDISSYITRSLKTYNSKYVCQNEMLKGGGEDSVERSGLERMYSPE